MEFLVVYKHLFSDIIALAEERFYFLLVVLLLPIAVLAATHIFLVLFS